MPGILVGVTGRAGSGKSTFAEMLVNVLMLRTPGQTHIVAFADRLRDVVAAAFGVTTVTQEQKAADVPFWRERLGPDFGTGRSILQRIGTELFRGHVHPDFWCWAFEERYGRRLAESNLVVADVRFDNEAKTVRRMGGTVVRVARAEADAAPIRHASERGVCPDLVDGVVDNSGDLYQLCEAATSYARCLVPGA